MKSPQKHPAEPRPHRTSRPSWWRNMLLLSALLILPVRATLLLSTQIDPRYLYGALAFVSIGTFYSFWADKRKAERDEWRTSESTLHLMELCGGWPAAFVAQRLFRHKTAKRSYQISFWGIILLYQYASYDFVQNWAWSKYIVTILGPIFEDH